MLLILRNRVLFGFIGLNTIVRCFSLLILGLIYSLVILGFLTNSFSCPWICDKRQFSYHKLFVGDDLSVDTGRVLAPAQPEIGENWIFGSTVLLDGTLPAVWCLRCAGFARPRT